MDRDISDAIMTILGTLPVDMEIRFYWHDGAQHVSMTYSDGSVDIGRLNRSPDGIGVVVPAAVH
ncbi:hypothetical protein DBB29_25005 [Pandoraea cepalis]|jgi:hypothetical protein|uniref:Halobacterial output domain-containing protein n=1 Tax=Pandoraea cepalis TaxID=2508294 RepID=A0AAW7MGR1_9BURK|nr:hypothetical protein [Pandoraea cepalis]MDN4571922.1 hypothetical protein [Pandoraea cepalis]MDN4581376.1 hypothetical protein [Pandoraea cepalis]